MRAALFSQALMILALTAAASGQAPESIAWLSDVETAKQIAQQTKRPILVHFWAPGCIPCQNLDQNVYADQNVKRAMESSFVLVRMNAADYPQTASLYGVDRWPTDVILAPDGKFIARMPCPPTARVYMGQLDTILRGPQAQGALASANMPAAAPSAGTPYLNQSTPSATTKWSLPNGVAAIPPQATNAPGYANQQMATAAPPQQAAAPANRVAYYDWGDQNGKTAAGAPLTANPSAYGQSQPVGGGAQSSLSAAPFGVVGYGAAANGLQPSESAAAVDRSRPSPGLIQEITPASVAPQQPVAPQYTMVPATQAPPLGLDGYCPVELNRMRTRYTKGDPRFGVVHRGRTYLFSSAEAQQEFLRDPDHYSPVMAGNDPVILFDQGQFVPGSRSLGLFVGDRVYLFANEQTRAKFKSDMHRYTDAVQVALGHSAGVVR